MLYVISDEWVVLPHFDFTSHRQKVSVQELRGITAWCKKPSSQQRHRLTASPSPFWAILTYSEGDPSHRQALGRDLWTNLNRSEMAQTQHFISASAESQSMQPDTHSSFVTIKNNPTNQPKKKNQQRLSVFLQVSKQLYTCVTWIIRYHGLFVDLLCLASVQ